MASTNFPIKGFYVSGSERTHVFVCCDFVHAFDCITGSSKIRKKDLMHVCVISRIETGCLGKI